MSKHSKHVSTLGCSTNFGDITLTKICVLRILHQDRHTGANLIVQVCFCNTTVQTNDITSARWLHCHHRYSDFSLCKSIVTLFLCQWSYYSNTNREAYLNQTACLHCFPVSSVYPSLSVAPFIFHPYYPFGLNQCRAKKKNPQHTGRKAPD